MLAIPLKVSKIRSCAGLASELVPVPPTVKMEVSNHPELQEKLQELEHELEVSRSVSKEKRSVSRLSRGWAQFCLDRK